MARFQQLLQLLEPYPTLYVQTHDFPDPDAIASACALSGLLHHFDHHAHVIYEGFVQLDSLRRMIEELQIEACPAHHSEVTAEDPILIVDGCKGNNNVTELVGREVGVIDHHLAAAPEDVPFLDIRPELGSCSTLIAGYYQEVGQEIPRTAATALLIGLLTDTALMTRRVSADDAQVYSDLYRRADIPLVNSILRNKIQAKDLDFYRHAIDAVQLSDRIAWCYLPEGCNQNLLGILGDFFLSLAEVDFVLLAAKNGSKVNVSVRSESRDWNAAATVRTLLRGIGLGGGHWDMAGGIVQDARRFDAPRMRNKLHATLASARNR